MKEVKCKQCNTKIQSKEQWSDFNGEYRHFEFGYCPVCNAFTSADGSPLLSAEGLSNEDDLLKWLNGGTSDTSVGIK